MAFVRLGDYIGKVDTRNKDGVVTQSMSVSVTKEFKPTGKKVNRNELHNYKVVKPGQFAYVPTTGNEKRLCVALSQFDYDIVVTQVDIVFEVNSSKLLSEFLYMYLFRQEMDRYARYHSWGSAREVFSWEDMREIEIPLPSLAKQREYVAIYRNLQRLTAGHESSFADLQLVSDTFMESLHKQGSLEKLGDYVRGAGVRNKGGAITKQAGLENKDFVAPKVKVTTDKRDTYKVIGQNQFACNLMHVGRDMRLPVGLYSEPESAIISPAYKIFEVSQPDKLLPEFLLLYFKRPETDRLMAYMTDSSVRQGLDWERLCEAQLPVPPLSVQRSIVAIHHALQTRKRLTERLRQTIKDISPVLIKNAKDIVES